MNAFRPLLGVMVLTGIACIGGGCKQAIPSSAFTAAPLSGTAPLTVQFTDMSTIVETGQITGWAWNFGDGSVSFDQHPEHTYGEAGAYTVALTVTASNGKTTTNRREDYVRVSEDRSRVDVLSITPPAAVPGEIIRVDITTPDTNTEYRVSFDTLLIQPLRIGDGFLTVMVPYLEPGDVSLAVVAAGSDSGGSGNTFTVQSPGPVSGEEAQNLITNLIKLVDTYKDYTLLSYEAIGGGRGVSERLSQGFDKCISIMHQASHEVSALSAEDRQILCQLIKGSRIGQRAEADVKILDDNRINYYHSVLAKKRAFGTMGDSEFFFVATRLDSASAVLSDVRSVLKGIRYASLTANFVPTLGQVVSAGAWASLSAIDVPLKIFDNIIDGVLPTDLKQVNIEALPLTGKLLNPGETASIKLVGTFGSQKQWTEVAADMILNATIGYLFSGDGRIAREARQFLDDIPGMDVDLRTTYARDLLDATQQVFVDAGFAVGDNIMDMPWEEVTSFGSLAWWEYNVYIDSAYYDSSPFSNLSNSFTGMVSFWGDDLASAMQSLMLSVLGEDTMHINGVVTVDDDSIVSQYDKIAGTITAKNIGTTRLHAHAYRFDKVVDILGLFPIEGWIHLIEGQQVTSPNGELLNVNTALDITVTNQSDPVTSELTDSPVSGIVPGVFTTDGGSFEISVSPVDSNGDLIYEDVSVKNFTFSPIQVTPLAAPDTLVARGMATADAIEAVLPGDPSRGVNVAIVLDSSGSMRDNDPNRERVAAAKALVDILRPEDQAAIFDFGNGSTSGLYYTRLLQYFTSDRVLLHQAIDRVEASNGTPMYQSLIEILELLQNAGLPNVALLLLTDGEADDSGYFDYVVASSQELSLPIFTVGLGESVDFTELQALGVQTEGTFSAVTDAIGLQSMFQSLGVAVSAGRLIVHASGSFIPALHTVGKYYVSGELLANISGCTIPTEFKFPVEVISVIDGYALKKGVSE